MAVAACARHSSGVSLVSSTTGCGTSRTSGSGTKSIGGTRADAAFDRLCELNVIEQARHVCETTVVQDAWAADTMAVHGWIYGLKDGRLHDLRFLATGPADMGPAYDRAIGRLSEGT